MGAIVCSTSAIVGAANVAPQVSDTVKHEAVQSNWMDRTDIAVGVQTGGQSKLDKGHFLTDDQNSIYNKQSDYGNLTKAYKEHCSLFLIMMRTVKVFYLYRGALDVAVRK